MKVIVLKTDDTYEVKEISGDLKSMQQIVDGYIELVRIAYPLSMVVNEEGLMKGLPANRIASSFYRGGHIAGDVFFAAEDDDEDFTDMIPSLAERIIEHIEDMGGKKVDG